MRKKAGKGIRSGLLLLGLCALTAGCGKEAGDLTGKVTYKGKPLEFGNVLVIASDSLSYAGEIQSNGTYTIKNVPIGPARLCVSAQDPKQAEELKRITLEQRNVGRQGGQNPGEAPRFDGRKLNAIPEVYGDPDRSGLTLDVQKGANDYDITLK